MRSALVFSANSVTTNRFELCASVFATVRRLHQRSGVVSESINDAFGAYGGGNLDPAVIAERFLANSPISITSPQKERHPLTQSSKILKKLSVLEGIVAAPDMQSCSPVAIRRGRWNAKALAREFDQQCSFQLADAAGNIERLLAADCAPPCGPNCAICSR